MKAKTLYLHYNSDTIKAIKIVEKLGWNSMKAIVNPIVALRCKTETRAKEIFKKRYHKDKGVENIIKAEWYGEDKTKLKIY